MTQDPVGNGPGPVKLSWRAIILALAVVIVIAVAVVVVLVTRTGPPSQPVAGPTSTSPNNPSPTNSRSHSPSPPAPRLKLVPNAGDALAQQQSPTQMNVNVPAVHNPGSVDAQLEIWFTLPDGTHPSFDQPETSCGGVLQPGSLCCVHWSMHGYKCNVPPYSKSGFDFGANVVGLSGKFQPGTKMYIQLPGESKPRVWKLFGP